MKRLKWDCGARNRIYVVKDSALLCALTKPRGQEHARMIRWGKARRIWFKLAVNFMTVALKSSLTFTLEKWWMKWSLGVPQIRFYLGKADQQYSEESFHEQLVYPGNLQSENRNCRIKESEAGKTFSFIFANGLIDLILTVGATEGNQYINHILYCKCQPRTHCSEGKMLSETWGSQWGNARVPLPWEITTATTGKC